MKKKIAFILCFAIMCSIIGLNIAHAEDIQVRTSDESITIVNIYPDEHIEINDLVLELVRGTFSNYFFGYFENGDFGIQIVITPPGSTACTEIGLRDIELHEAAADNSGYYVQYLDDQIDYNERRFDRDITLSNLIPDIKYRFKYTAYYIKNGSETKETTTTGWLKYEE